MFQGRFKGVPRKFFFSRKIEGCFNGALSGFQGCLKKVQGAFERSFKGVLGVLQDSFLED